MPSMVDYCVWIICVLLEVAVVVTAARRHALRRYIFLNIYMGSSLLVSVGRYQVLHRSGLSSLEYAYFYYYSDALLTIGLYFALLNLYNLVFDQMKVDRYLRLGAVLLLGGTAWFRMRSCSNPPIAFFLILPTNSRRTSILWALC